MQRQAGVLSLAAIGVIALIAGLGRLVQAFVEQDPAPDLVPIPVLVASAAFGLIVTVFTARALAQLFIESHPGVRSTRVRLAVVGVGLLIILAWVAGVSCSRPGA